MAVVAEMKKTNDHAETTKVDRLKYTKMFNYIEVYYSISIRAMSISGSTRELI